MKINKGILVGLPFAQLAITNDILYTLLQGIILLSIEFVIFFKTALTIEKYVSAKQGCTSERGML